VPTLWRGGSGSILPKMERWGDEEIEISVTGEMKT